MIGEYVGRIYDEVKHRPLYIVREERNRPDGAAAARRAARRPRARACRRARPSASAEPRRAGATTATAARRTLDACSTHAMSAVTEHDARRRTRAAVRRWPRALRSRCALALACGGARRPAPPARAPKPAPGAGPARRARTRRPQIIGQRAEGVLRFPEAVAVDATGDVYVADQLSYVVQKFSAAGAFETEWGSFGGGHGQFGPIGGLATDAGGQRVRGRLEPRPDREVRLRAANFITAWGHKRQRTRASSTSAPRRTPPSRPGGGIAVAGNYVYVADSGNNRIERFNLEGRRSDRSGAPRAAAAGSSPTRAASRPTRAEVIVADDDNHRIEKFSPERRLRGRSRARTAAGRGSSASPTASRSTRRATCTWPTTSTTAWSSSTRSSAFLGAWGGFGSKPGQLAFPRALASDPAGDTYVADTANDRVEVFDPSGDFLRTIGTSRARPRRADGARAGSPSTRPGGCSCPTRSATASSAFAPGSDAFAGSGRAAGGHSAGFDAPGGHRRRPARARCTSPTPATRRVVHLWGDGTFLAELGRPGRRSAARS